MVGTPDRPRLSVYRSLAHIYAQIIDDHSGKTLVSSNSLAVEGGGGSKSDRAKVVGEKIAVLAKAAHIEKVVFDRGGYLYHGRVKALADAARAGGLLF
jgi:large subunit ribosomal protein L18